MQRRGRPKGRPKTGGRKKGTPNVVTASIKSALTEAFDGLGGVPALVRWGKANPTPFYQCWSRLAPKDPGGHAEREPITLHVVRADPEPTFATREAQYLHGTQATPLLAGPVGISGAAHVDLQLNKFGRGPVRPNPDA